MSEIAIVERLVELLMGPIPLPDETTCHEYTSKNFDWTTTAQKVQHERAQFFICFLAILSFVFGYLF